MNVSQPDEGFAVGHNINGKYIVEKQIGAGGMGLTYLACDADNIKRKLVVKTILRALSNPEGHTAFLKEGEALGRINHDGVVRLFDKGEDAKTGLPFLIMEFVKGTPLNEIIGRGKMDLLKAVRIIEKIAFALNAAHSENVLHRDLKPANVMIIESDIEGEKVKLIDFGVAKVADSIVGGDTTLFGGFKGTLQYASPEQLSGFQTISGETFNLAALIYEMLTQVRPFQVAFKQGIDEDRDIYIGRYFEQIKNLQKAGAKSPREYNPNISGTTANVILKGLEYESSDRYKTPLDFAAALKNSLIEAQSDVEPIPDVQVEPKKSSRKAVLPAAILLSLLSIGLLGLVNWRSFLNSDQTTNANLQVSKPTTTPNEPETLFNYSFEVQKMKNNLPDGKVFAAADKSKISFGDKFNLKIERQKGGHFYIVKQTNDNLDLIFPIGNPDVKNIEGWHLSKPNQSFWFVWSEDGVGLLEQKPLNQIEVERFLRKNQNSLDVKENQAKMNVKGSGNVEIFNLSL